MAPRHEIEAGIAARTKLLELLEPLPLQIVAASDDLPYLHPDFHSEPSEGRDR